LIGPYPFDEYGYIVIVKNFEEGNFAMETQTIVMISRDWLMTPKVEGVLAHELVHQWFGDSVSLASWNEVWLKEGLASYLMYMWLDHQGYVEISTFLGDSEANLDRSGYMLDQPLNQPLSSDMYGGNTYDKGAWVFHMLRQEIGDENFTQFLREYYLRYTGSSASTAELQSVAEGVSGKDLDTFFNQWVYGSGIPHLDVNWTAQTGNVTIQVCQASTGQLFTLPLRSAEWQWREITRR
jgi:aminopeptidase N